MRAGRLRQRLAILRHQPAVDELGQDTAVYLEAGELWAAVEDLGGVELIQAIQIHAEVSVAVTARQAPAVLPTDRLRTERNRLLEVLAVTDHEGRNRERRILCKETVD